MTNEEKLRSEFIDLVKPIIKWINENHNPHTTVVVDVTGAEVFSGTIAYQTFEFVKD